MHGMRLTRSCVTKHGGADVTQHGRCCVNMAEKKMEAQLAQRIEEVREQVRQDVVNHLQEQLQVRLVVLL